MAFNFISYFFFLNIRKTIDKNKNDLTLCSIIDAVFSLKTLNHRIRKKHPLL
jgi:hypothetical protein